MTVPCTCQIPDPVVVNGECLVCRGDRSALLAQQLPAATKGPLPSGRMTPRKDGELLREERHSSAESDGGQVPGWRSL